MHGKWRSCSADAPRSAIPDQRHRKRTGNQALVSKLSTPHAVFCVVGLAWRSWGHRLAVQGQLCCGSDVFILAVTFIRSFWVTFRTLNDFLCLPALELASSCRLFEISQLVY